MSIYDVVEIERKLELIAMANEGEIPEELLRDLVEAETKSLEKVGNICKFIRHLELYVDTCKLEEERIKALKDKAKNRIKSIKKYLTPYVLNKGKIDVGTFKLSVRKSEKVILADGWENHSYGESKTTFHPDKTAIKKAIKNGEEIDGAKLESYDNLQLK